MTALPSAIEDRIVTLLEFTGDARRAAVAELCAEQPEQASGIRAFVEATEVRSQVEGQTLVDAFRRIAADGIGATMVGPYRVLQRIGEGAHGEVYLAEQEEPVRRKVALKLLRAGTDHGEILARFEAERQALALLDHPGIAKVIDAGALRDGRPFFALELVASAASLTGFCRSERIALNDRLELFCKICDAVQHAHSRGILHRDLKPGNVLCTRQDATVVPKVIDFGIAKATGGRLTERSFHTVAGSPIGTPAYMSPEQARGALDVDTRTDVYSLGAILHELLCGEPPFGEHGLSQLYDEDRALYFQILTEREPDAPSRRLVATDATTVFGDPLVRTLRSVRGDLDAIAQKALACERDRRYPTVSELAADVRRVLDGEPVQARGPGLGYRLGKLLRRHTAACVLTAVTLVSLVAAVVYVSAANDELATRNAELGHANSALEQQRGKATEEARRAITALARLQAKIQEIDEARRVMRNVAAGVERGKATELTLAAWCEGLAKTLDGADHAFAPGVEAALRQTLAWLYCGIGRRDRARVQLERAISLRDDQSSEARLERAGILHALGDAVSPPGRDDLSIIRLQEAHRLFLAELGPKAPQTLAVQGDLGFMMQNHGSTLQKMRGTLLVMRACAAVLGDPDQAKGSLPELMKEVYHLRDQITVLVAAGDLDGAYAAVDKLLQPAIDEPVFRIRLCNALWAASTFDAVKPLQIFLLCAAVRFGERFNGRAHDHTMLARSFLGYALFVRARKSKSKSDIALALAHLTEQQELSSVAFGHSASLKRQDGRSYIAAIALALAQTADGEIDALIEAVEATGVLGANDLAALRKSLAR